MTPSRPPVIVRPTTLADIPHVIELTRRVYPESPPWTEAQLATHLRVFPEGQMVARRRGSEEIAGMAASLIVRWDDYDSTSSWRDFTAHGTFTNHDTVHGHTLYGAEVMVDPALQRSGIGAALYRARRDLAICLGLLRIRAAARLRGYHRHSHRMSAEEYVSKVVRGQIKGPTLSFQLREGFRVIQVVPGYLQHDPESQGYAAIIEWLNPEIAHDADAAGRDPATLPEQRQSWWWAGKVRSRAGAVDFSPPPGFNVHEMRPAVQEPRMGSVGWSRFTRPRLTAGSARRFHGTPLSYSRSDRTRSWL